MKLGKMTGLDAEVATAFKLFVDTGENPNPDLYVVSNSNFYHRREYPAAGQLQFTFFNADYSQPVTNWPSSKGLSNNNAYICEGFGFHLELNADSNGDEVAGCEPLDTHATAPTALDLVEAIRGVADQGFVEFKIGARRYGEGYGLSSFPGAAGTVISGGMSHFSTTQAQALPILNGMAFAGNFVRFPEPVIVYPNRQPAIVWTQSSTRTVPTKFVVRAQMFGTLFSHNNAA